MAIHYLKCAVIIGFLICSTHQVSVLIVDLNMFLLVLDWTQCIRSDSQIIFLLNFYSNKRPVLTGRL